VIAGDKVEKPETSPVAERQDIYCLLDIVGKLFERILYTRRGNHREHQRPRKSAKWHPAHKTKAVLLSSRKKVENMLAPVNGTQVTSQEYLKYLGVMIDHRLSFKDHASYARKNAAITASSLSRLMPNVGGPRHPARKLLVAAAKASLLYAAPIWSNPTYRGSYLKGALSVLRSMALSLVRGFRTISEDAVLWLAGLPPIDLEIKALSPARGTHVATG